MAKRISFLIFISLAMILTGCDIQVTQNETPPSASSSISDEELQKDYTVIKSLTKDDIIGNLNTSDYFWIHISPRQYDNPAQAYSITELSINGYESTSENETLFVTILAESPFANYTGDFILKYVGNKKDGYTLSMAYQDFMGIYEITSFPTEELAVDWYSQQTGSISKLHADSLVKEWNMRQPPELLSSTALPKGELLSTSIQEIKGRSDLCEVQYDLSFQLDEYCSANESIFSYCRFEAGIWNLTSSPSRSAQIAYTYNIPPVSSPEIASAVLSIIPEYIGTYSMDSGTIVTDKNDPLLTHISGCKLTSTNFDASQFALNLDLRYDTATHFWSCENISTDGCLSFKSSENIDIPDGSGEREMSVKISELAFDLQSDMFFAAVTTTETNPGRGGILAGKAVERTMELTQMASQAIPQEEYYLHDGTYYIYLDADFVPLSYNYTN